MKSNTVTIKLLHPQSNNKHNNITTHLILFQQRSRPQTSEDDIKKWWEKICLCGLSFLKLLYIKATKFHCRYKLYFRIQYQSLQAIKNPNYNGFLSENLNLPEQNPNQEPPIRNV